MESIKGFREVKEYEDGNFRFLNCLSHILNNSCECSFGAVAMSIASFTWVKQLICL